MTDRLTDAACMRLIFWLCAGLWAGIAGLAYIAWEVF